MSDNAREALGIVGGRRRTLDRSGISTPVMALDVGGDNGLESLVTTANPLPIAITDSQLGKTAEVNSLRRLVTTEVVRLVGSLFESTTKDTQQWQEAIAGTGTVTQAQGEVLLSTGATANSSVAYSTIEHARFIAGTINVLSFTGFLVTPATANNERRVGVGEFTSHTPASADTPLNGYGVYLRGTEFGIWYRSLSQNPTDIVRVPSGSFSTGKTFTPTTDEVLDVEIEYGHTGVSYFINGELYHTQVPTTDMLSDTMNLHAFAQNINSGGSTTPVSFMVHVLSVLRYGRSDTTPITRRAAGAATTVLKSGPGQCHTIINAVKVAASVISVWDGVTNAPPSRRMLTIDGANFQGALEFKAVFRDGLTLVTDKAANDVTVIYE